MIVCFATALWPQIISTVTVPCVNQSLFLRSANRDHRTTAAPTFLTARQESTASIASTTSATSPDVPVAPDAQPRRAMDSFFKGMQGAGEGDGGIWRRVGAVFEGVRGWGV